MTIAYEGSAFAGWQSQVSGNTGQDALQRAFAALCEKRVIVHGAGRTDAGVHAIGQVAHADIPDGRFTTTEWMRALNAHLPAEIRVMKCTVARQDFHARYSAREKIYRYTIWNNSVFLPLHSNRAWHVPWKLDFPILKAACEIFVGRHDFAAFAAGKREEKEKTIRRIYSIKIVRRGSKIEVTFEGEGFLYKMVRILVAAAVRCAAGKMNVTELARFLENGSPRVSHVAPAHGLCLMHVVY